jgi:hypothetical protein
MDMKIISRVAVSAALLAGAALAQSELHGILIDAGCRDRSAVNLAQPAERFSASVPVQMPAAVHGITVDAKTAEGERADVVMHQVPDLATRQPDPTCAITGGTRGYAVLLENGKLLDLDEGGNTFASEAVFATKQGRDLLNGRAYGFKPHVTIQGRIAGAKLLATSVHCTP